MQYDTCILQAQFVIVAGGTRALNTARFPNSIFILFRKPMPSGSAQLIFQCGC